jgi:hypothetical protein
LEDEVVDGRIILSPDWLWTELCLVIWFIQYFQNVTRSNIYSQNYTLQKSLFFFSYSWPLTRELAPILQHRAHYWVTWFFTDGRTLLTGDRHVARSRPKHRTTQTQKNMDTH